MAGSADMIRRTIEMGASMGIGLGKLPVIRGQLSVAGPVGGLRGYAVGSDSAKLYGDQRSEQPMTFRGRVKNGVVTLDDPSDLPDGTAVSVRPLKASPRPAAGPKEVASLYERLKPVIGKAVGLPPDAALNHDHYLYGVPKRGRK